MIEKGLIRHALLLTEAELVSSAGNEALSISRQRSTVMRGAVALADEAKGWVFATAALETVEPVETATAGAGEHEAYLWRLNELAVLDQPFRLEAGAVGPIWARLRPDERTRALKGPAVGNSARVEGQPTDAELWTTSVTASVVPDEIATIGDGESELYPDSEDNPSEAPPRNLDQADARFVELVSSFPTNSGHPVKQSIERPSSRFSLKLRHWPEPERIRQSERGRRRTPGRPESRTAGTEQRS